MNIGEICSRNVHVVKRELPLPDAVRKMMQQQIGALVVIESSGPTSAPIGMLTDRDILCGQLSRRADIHCLTVGEVMTANPVILEEDCGIDEAIRRLSESGIRRAPVVDQRGHLIGLVSFDDLLPAVAKDLESLAQLIGLHRSVATATSVT